MTDRLSRPPDAHEQPRMPVMLIGLLLLLVVAIAVIFLLAAQMVQTP